MRDRKSDTHRNVAEKEAGKKLPASVSVDHKDGNKANNAPGNLQPMDRDAHNAKTAKDKGLNKLRKALTMQERGEKLY